MGLKYRFTAFWPLGNKAQVEYDTICLMEAYNQPYSDIMSMPSSRRHRLIKIREDIVRQQNAKNRSR